MRQVAATVLVFALCFPSFVFGADESPLAGFSAQSTQAEREWETKFRAIPDPAILRESMKRLSAHPHHVGSPYDKENAEWILSQFQQWGLDSHIENLTCCFQRPRSACWR